MYISKYQPSSCDLLTYQFFICFTYGLISTILLLKRNFKKQNWWNGFYVRAFLIAQLVKIHLTLHYSGLENSMDTVHGVAKSWKQLSDLHFFQCAISDIYLDLIFIKYFSTFSLCHSFSYLNKWSCIFWSVCLGQTSSITYYYGFSPVRALWSLIRWELRLRTLPLLQYEFSDVK